MEETKAKCWDCIMKLDCSLTYYCGNTLKLTEDQRERLEKWLRLGTDNSLP